MEQPFSWTCPYCGQPTTITSANADQESLRLDDVQQKKLLISLFARAIGCPNPSCGELTLAVSAFYTEWNGAGYVNGEKIGEWKLLPESSAKPIPEYVPEAIRDAYQQAARIVELSPNASAALSRRCLQGIIRDFWQLPEGKRSELGAEISAISDRIDPALLAEIKAIRAIGDIGAHMDKYVDVTVDVERDEARLLVTLIEMLIEQWYVERHKRAVRTKELHGIVERKRAQQREIKAERKALGSVTSKPKSDESGGTQGT